MSSAPIDFLNLLVDHPGDLLYFMIMVAVTLAGLLMALGERLRNPGLSSAIQYSTAFGGALLAWTLLMFGALFNVLAAQNPVTILPPLERVINVIVILLIAWAFMTADAPKNRRFAGVVLLIMLMTTIGGYIVTGMEWPGLANQTDFNLTSFGFAWTFVPAVIAALGMLLIVAYFRTVLDAPLKLVCLSLLFLGHAGALWQITQGTLIGHYAGLPRLAFLAALPMSVMVVYRMVITSLQTDLFNQSSQSQAAPLKTSAPQPDLASVRGTLLPAPPSTPILSPLQRDSVQLLKTLGLILEEASPTDIPQRIITAALEVLKGDVGAVLALQDANYADIIAAYDKVLERPIAGLALNLDNQPTLVNTIERRLQRPLFPDRNPEELSDLYTRLDITQIGPTYFQPLISGRELVGVLIVGMPYSGRELSDAERELLKGIGVIAGSLLALSLAAQDARLKGEERAIQALVQGVPLDRLQDTSATAAAIQDDLQLARDQVEDLSRQVTALQRELDQERMRVSSSLGDTEEGLSVSQRILALHEEQQRLRDEREQLSTRLQEAEAALASATAGGDAILRRMIESLRREKTELIAQRDALQTQLDELRQSGDGAPANMQDALKRMAEEKARLEAEREQLQVQLADLEIQLAALGIEDGPTRLLQLAHQISEQRAAIQTLTWERDALLKERAQFQEAILREKEREARIEILQTEIKNLAVDRETALKQRDQFRAERDELLEKQDLNKQQRARLLAEASAYQMELAEAHQELAKLRQQVERLTRERDQLLEQGQISAGSGDALISNPSTRSSDQLVDERIAHLTRQIEELTRQRDQLEAELQAARGALATTAGDGSYASRGLNGQLAADLTPEDFRLYNPDLILGMVQELRTPMTSIVGYVNLLLDEAAGILGEMQRKFLQRVAANITRMTSMLDDLTRVAALDSDRFTLTPRPLDIVSLIEDVITESSAQFREKGLTIHLNLDDSLPRVRADHDAVHQIIKQLCTNAYLVSPTGSQIFITAHSQQVKLAHNPRFANAVDSVLISVEDRGGGIAPEDLPRVFARKYKADNPLVLGLGDTGVGLSIAKTLAEAHGGGLWVETREGTGSIFYFALPIITPSEHEG